MNINKLSLVNVIRNPVDTSVSMILMSLGVAIISMMLLISNATKNQLESNLGGVDMVIGAKGSPIQVILSSIFHIDNPTGNISLSEVKKIVDDPLIQSAVPVSFGDNYKNYRIVGTSKEFPDIYSAQLKSGKIWSQNLEVTIGSSVAQKTKLKIGDKFYGSHGLGSDGHVHDNYDYVVVGIFEQSNSVLDNLILTDTQSVWMIHSNDILDNQDKMITSMLVKFKSPIGLIQIPRKINSNTTFQAALPSMEINRMIDLLGFGISTINIIALLIIVVSGVSIFLNLYNSLRKRRFELALIRVYGANKLQLMRLILQESILISFFGTLLGFAISRLTLVVILNVFVDNHNLDTISLSFIDSEIVIVMLAFIVGIFASIIPVYKAYKIDAIKTLSNA